MSTPTSSSRRHRRGQRGEADDVGEHQRDVLEAVGDERLAGAQPLGDGLGQDVQQQPLVLAGQPLTLLDRGDVGAIDIDEAELGDIDRQQGIRPPGSLDLDGLAVACTDALQQLIP